VSDEAPRGGAGGGWWVVVVLVVVAVVLLVWRPWEASPAPEPTPSPTSTPTVDEPKPTPEPTPEPTQTPGPPGADTVFTTETAQELFVPEGTLTGTIPGAADGLTLVIGTGEQAWGLPEGSTVDPSSCTIARTVVADAPAGGYDARGYQGDDLGWVQEVTLLADPGSARLAFAELVTTVDGCPTYAQVTGATTDASWTADPALEGQGLYPSIVQELSTQAGDRSSVGYRGHLLIGNAIVAWTAQDWGTGGTDDLGPADDLAQMVEDRVLAAVQALG
jgi:hypothetical protein